MRKPTASQKVMDRLNAALERERIQSRFIEDLDEEPFCRFEEWAHSLSEVAEAIGRVKESLESYQYAEDREDKRTAKEEALEALDTLVSAWNSSPLDLSILEDWAGGDE